MIRNIVLCSDGTGSKGFQKRGTNVYKLFEAVDLHGHGVGPNSPKQITFYDDGVGTETAKWRKILGSAFGLGLSKNVKQLYANLVRTYKEGDRIYLFGFSRGAFTVRTLAGLINTYGIIDRRHLENDTELSRKVDKLYEQYRRKYKASISPLVHRLRDKYCANDKKIRTIEVTPIEFIGVWDTVDAVGAPIPWLADKMNKYIYCFKFKDFELSSEEKVKKACHALSIDDERLTFHPVLWDEKPKVDKEDKKGEENKEEKKDNRIEQVWFAGVHANVGGGYPKHGMSLVSLYWMMSKAEQSGLRFIKQDRELFRHRRNVTDKLYDSRSGIGVYYRYKPRDIGGEFCKKYHIITPKIHNSVIERIKQRTEGYAPGNIPFKCKFVPTDWNYENYDQFIQEFSKNLNGEKSLLDRDNVKRLVSKRCKSHRYFLITSIITILSIVSIILVANIPHFSFTGIVGTFFKLFSIKGLIELFKGLLAKQLFLIITVIAPVIVPFVFYLIIRRLKKAMNGRFSEFWYAILKEVDKIKKDSG
ncbi:MAG TPA: DUF2235 domain-containing protein [Candidatus Scalindua sp.]|nr:DUF2235 domain-containing protein [Candidatus Scalindua sp.]